MFPHGGKLRQLTNYGLIHRIGLIEQFLEVLRPARKDVLLYL